MEIGKLTVDRRHRLGCGFGQVFMGFFNGQKVAVKRIEHHERQCDREEKALRILNHPNIVRLLHVEDTEDFRFYALELCVASMDQLFLFDDDPKKYKGPPLPRSIKVLSQLTDGLAYIHSNDLVHRDIKPANVLISCNGSDVTLKWADFGLAKEVDQFGTYEMSGVRGTLYWMAPEILCYFNQREPSGGLNINVIKLTALSDVFSAGCLFFKFLTGFHPYGNNIFTDVLSNIQLGDPVNLRKTEILPETHFAYDCIESMLKQIAEDRWEMKKVLHFIQEKMETELYDLCSVSNPTNLEVNELAKLVKDKDCPDLNKIIGKEGLTPLELICRSNQGSKLRRCIEIILGNEDEDKENRETAEDAATSKVLKGTMALCNICGMYLHEDLLDIVQLLIQRTKLYFNPPNSGIEQLFSFLMRNTGRWKDSPQTPSSLANIIDLLIEKTSASINAESQDGETALHYLLRFFKGEIGAKIATILIERGIEVNAKDKEGRSALHYLLCFYKSDDGPEIVKLLIESGINTSFKDEKEGLNVLHFLFTYYNGNKGPEIAKAVIENDDKGLVNEKDELGRNAFHYLLQFYKNDEKGLEMAKLLIQNGIDVNAKDLGGRNALHYLFLVYGGKKKVEIAKLLLESGIDIQAKDANGLNAQLFLKTYQGPDKLEIQNLLPPSVDQSNNLSSSKDTLTSSKLRKVGEYLSYDLGQVIGRGSYSIIFKGLISNRHSKSPKSVAVKRLQLINIMSHKSISEFKTELILKCGEHPNILEYLFVEMDSDFMFIATELCGGTLQSLIKGEYQGQEICDRREILRQVTEGLAYLHRKDIIHRDIKPTNILIFESSEDDGKIVKPRMKLADFGLNTFLLTDQRDFDNKARKSSPKGTLGWLAPELYEHKQYDFKVDIFPLGCIFSYTLGDGKHPFGDDADRQVIRIKKKEPMLLVQEDLKKPYSDNDIAYKLIQSMLAMEPRKRPTAEVILKNPFFDEKEEHLIGEKSRIKPSTELLDFLESCMESNTSNFPDASATSIDYSFTPSADGAELQDNERVLHKGRTEQFFKLDKSTSKLSSEELSKPVRQAEEKEMCEVTYDRNRMLGKGAYGKVFQGKLINTKTGIETKVAVKRYEMLRVDKSRTLVEMHLNHPNVVKLLHYEDVEDIFRLCCLELCDASLEKAFLPDDDPRKYKGPLLDELDFMLQLSLGLDYIHNKNLVHRDVKPDNILIHSPSSTEQVLIKLSDFVLSKDTKNGEFVMSSRDDKGTMYYWPPEIFSFYDKMNRLSNETSDENILRTTLTNKIDIFSCGNVFFNFLTKGMHSFGTEEKEIVVNLRQSQPVNLIKVFPPSHFAFNMIRRMLEKKEGDRPNAGEIIPLLSSIQQNTTKTDQSFNMIASSEKKSLSKSIQPRLYIKPKILPSAQVVSRYTFFNFQMQKHLNETTSMDSTTASLKQKSTKKIKVDESSEQAVVLGRGCHGTIVFKGRYDGRDVAVKRIQMQNAQIEANREKEDLLMCQHPNVLQLFKVEEDYNFMRLALELCAGNLSDFCLGRYSGPFPADIEAMKQMLKGLSYLHERRYIHRDIKPNSILISISGTLKISDFGFCKPIGSSDNGSFSMSNAATGTEGWIAPELLRYLSAFEERRSSRTMSSASALISSPTTSLTTTTSLSFNNSSSNSYKFKATPAIDVFPLGCVFYYLLTRGSHPFGSGAYRIINILEGRHNLSELGRKHIIKGLIREMIHHSPKHRPQLQEILTRPIFNGKSTNDSPVELFRDANTFERLMGSLRMRFTPKPRSSREIDKVYSSSAGRLNSVQKVSKKVDLLSGNSGEFDETSSRPTTRRRKSA